MSRPEALGPVAGWPPAPLTRDGVTIRRTVAADRAPSIDLATDADVHRHLGGPRDRAAMEQETGEVPSDRPGAFAVEIDGRYAGLVTFARRGPDRGGHVLPGGGELDLGCALFPEHWGRGAAHTALTLALEWAAGALPDHVVVLSTRSANEAAVTAAERLGFAEVERYEEDGEEQWFAARPLRCDDRVVLVAAYARNRVIGAGGEIPWRIPEDFAHFKSLTMGGTLVMGRATYDSIGRPLPGRTTVVVTRDPSWRRDGVLVAHSVEEALGMAADQPGETFVAGGGQIYSRALPRATHQVLTEVDLEVEGDAFYPDFDRREWRETRREPGPGCAWVWWERTG